jgi:hypothetical protein
MSNRRRIQIAVPAVLFVFTAAFIAALVFGHGTSQPLGSALGIGTLSSLAATLIMSLAKTVTEAQGEAQTNRAAFPGLLRISTKSQFESDDWLQLLRNAKTEFYIAGHSLGRWCSPSNRDEFKTNIQRILNRNGSVTLVMLAPTSAQIALLQRATSVDYRDRIHTSHCVLAELCAELQPSVRNRLRISVLADHPALPYLVVGNEQRLVTATYLASSDSDDVACLELERSSRAATAVYDDFHKLAEAGQPAILPVPPQPIATNRARFWRRLFG